MVVADAQQLQPWLTSTQQMPLSVTDPVGRQAGALLLHYGQQAKPIIRQCSTNTAA